MAGVLVCQSSRADDPPEYVILKAAVDYEKLKSALGSKFLFGAGVPIADIAPSVNPPNPPNPPIYHPNPDYSEFLAAEGVSQDPFGQRVTFLDASGGAANGDSGHATTNVGQYFYGNNFSFSPGANTVTIYEVNDWLTNVLKLNGGTPASHDFRVENFSWIFSFGTESPGPELDAQALSRIDYLIDNNNITAVVGINAGGTPQIIFSHSLNAIAVGVTPGSNPNLPTVKVTDDYDYPGRNKPDMVAPGGGSSATTASVSSAATLLHESGAGTDSARSETMKAVLLAGATKEEFPSWSHSSTQPLDSVFGAGELNVYNSYVIQSGGLKPDPGSLNPGTPGSYLPESKFPGSTTEPTSSVGIDGWDYRTATDGASLYYNLEVPTGSTATELSVVLAWNSEVNDTDPAPSIFTPVVSLDNLDLRLYDSSGSFLGGEIDTSVSTVDNVEHIHLTGLGPGTYTLEVTNLTGGGSRDFGLAWRLETLFDVPSADFDEDGDVDGMDFLAWQRNFGTLTGAIHGDGDADGDGDVDEDDRLIYNSGLGSGPGPGPLSAFGNVPEPGTLALGAIGLSLVLLLGRVRKLG